MGFGSPTPFEPELEGGARGEQKWAPGKAGSSDISFEARRAFGRGLQLSMGGLEDASPPKMGVHFDLEHFPGRARAANLLKKESG